MNDITIARKYISKMQNASANNIEFDLPLISFMNVCRSKKCYYTGLPLDRKTLSVDRVNSSLGYVSGNVVAAHEQFNQFKAIIENPINKLTLDNTIKGLQKFKSKLNSQL